jgi:D-glycero-D-manno-heptose 1,7-bisphosphate phosphatase
VNRAVFLDRDGTVIEERGYLSDPALVCLLPGAAQALRTLHAEGWKLFFISNQSGLGRGFFSPDQMNAVHHRCLEILTSEGVEITDSYLCVHSPEDGCPCRKPSPWLLEQASRDHDVDLKASWMIGDREGDILCGRNAGCCTIWLRNREFTVADGLATAAADNWQEIYRSISCPGE